ncbi:FHA domain-containing protein [Isosphaeraceae bacterium EP7]
MGVCTNCQSTLGPGARSCPRCGRPQGQAQPGEFDTILPPKRPAFGAGAAAPDSGLIPPARPAAPPPADRERDRDRDRERPAKPRPRPQSPAPREARPEPAAAPGPAQPPPGWPQSPPPGYWYPPPGPQGEYAQPYPYPAPAMPQPAPPPPREAPGLLGRLRGLIGGEQGHAPHPAQAPLPPGYYGPGGHGPQPQPQPGYAPQPYAPPPPAPAQPYAPPPVVPAQPGPPGHAPVPQHPPVPRQAPPQADDDGRTQFAAGFNFKNLRPKQPTLLLQIFDVSGEWIDYAPIHATGLNVGRSKQSSDHPGLGTMASRHMRLAYDDGKLVVEDLGSLNGVYLRVTAPVELVDGMRFRVGVQVIEFRAPDPFEPMAPAVSDDGEEFCSRDPEPFGALDLIRPNNRVGLRFPITSPDRTIIGRESSGKLEGHRIGVNLVLANDTMVSGIHAQVRRSGKTFVLEDLGSRNGTFLHVLGSRPVRPGDVLQAGRVLFRIHDPGRVDDGPGRVY